MVAVEEQLGLLKDVESQKVEEKSLPVQEELNGCIFLYDSEEEMARVYGAT